MSMNKATVVVCLIVSAFISESNAQSGMGWKAAIIDTGFYDDDPIPQSKRDGRACYSIADEEDHRLFRPGTATFHSIVGPFDGVTAGTINHYNKASTCPNGYSISTAVPTSSVVPREAGHFVPFFINSQNQVVPYPTLPDPVYYRFGYDHGSNVAQAFLEQAPNANIFMINASYFESGNTNGDIALGGGCQWHSYTENDRNCFRFAQSSLSLALDRVRNLNLGVAAVNLSLGNPNPIGNCNNNALRTQVSQLNNLGIPVFAALGNDSTDLRPDDSGVERPRWPACMPGVIAVGAVDTNDSIQPYNNSAGRVDFWALGRIESYNGTGGIVDGTSFAAPRVTGAFTSVKSAVPTATTQQILAALTATGVSLTDTRSGSGATAPRINGTTVSAAINVLLGNTLFTVFESPNGDFTGEQFGTTFGPNNYQFGVTLAFPAITLNANNTPTPPSPPPGFTVSNPSIDGYQIRFRSRDLSSGELRIYINGTFYRNVASGSNRLNTYTIDGPEFQNLFSSGANEIEFRHNTSFIGSEWGIEDIEITPIVDYDFIEIPAGASSIPAIQLLLLN